MPAESETTGPQVTEPQTTGLQAAGSQAEAPQTKASETKASETKASDGTESDGRKSDGAEPRTEDQSAVLPETMSAIVAPRYGTHVLERREVPVPTVEKHQVLIKVAASSLNALDWHLVTGTPYMVRLVQGLRKPKRSIPGADVVGEVVAIGSEVTRLRVGDRVFGESPGGGFAPYSAAPESHMACVSNDVSDEAAGATPVAALTAIQALRTHADVQPGEHVLINGAAGGVGTFSVQIAKALGATVTAVCSTGNVDMVAGLGADEVVDYRTQDFVAGGARFDVMVDNVGSRTPAENISVLKPGARYVAVSGPKANNWLDPMRYILRMAIAIRRTEATLHQFTASPNHEDMVMLAEMLADGRIVPAIDRVIGLDQVQEAFTQIGGGHAPAKIVVKPE